jgi:hypothetical protein
MQFVEGHGHPVSQSVRGVSRAGEENLAGYLKLEVMDFDPSQSVRGVSRAGEQIAVPALVLQVAGVH